MSTTLSKLVNIIIGSSFKGNAPYALRLTPRGPVLVFRDEVMRDLFFDVVRRALRENGFRLMKIRGRRLEYRVL